MNTDSTNPPSTSTPLFSLGTVVATPGALDVLTENNVLAHALLQRHVTGDWGELDEHDRHQNQFALRSGLRILSSYVIGESIKIWIITEADRSSTTILLPEEY
ncbi:MAG TPA: hypothetical protein VK832_02675 [Burkholderiaceae bacterium]|jgi:hypothetical protein|nr:hypothetical protein [Burkholderiaceae bacterium]